ncbi:23S rRNA (uracil(1939)-C(5))-methyltransferase RlmD [Candidatus Marinamargulisbacteria bacterium SCGC AG-439-L15]|nr:23S rRNA (uracil(1939)-C(5))-methyltransferase RlmD [Candidatus Marinamargulisbacteria bacterium SCGC AG-439-L15]
MFVKNEVLGLDIIGVTDKGLGYGFLNDREIRVPFTAPGDEIEVLIVKVTKTIAYGKLLSLIKSSSLRVAPPCPIFAKCGGCQLQHLNSDSQEQFKRDSLQSAFEGKGLSLPRISYVRTEPFHYRYKAQYGVSKNEDGQYVVGLSAMRSQRLVDCETCAIQNPVTNEALALFRDFLTRYQAPVFNPKTGESGIAHLWMRVGEDASGDSSLMLSVVSSTPLPDYHEPLIKHLTALPELKSVYFSYNDNPEWTILGDENTLIWGDPSISTVINGIEQPLSLHSFSQANHKGTAVLWEQVLSFLDPRGSESLLELYCGAGGLSCFLAPYYTSIVGMELSASAIKDAQALSKRLGLSHLHFVKGDVLQSLDAYSERPDHVLCDPPRRGMDKAVIDEIIKKDPQKIVYVSCSEKTLARDIVLFERAGYEIKACTMMDLFAQTYHMESLLLLEKTPKSV